MGADGGFLGEKLALYFEYLDCASLPGRIFYLYLAQTCLMCTLTTTNETVLWVLHRLLFLQFGAFQQTYHSPSRHSSMVCKA